MPNPIKYSTGSETLALKKGNFYIGTGDVGKGPTESTGYWNGISPPTSGYTIYLSKETQGPSAYVAPTDNDLITITNQISGQNYTGVTECLTYFASQTDKIVLNTDYPSIVTDGLVLNLDAGFVPSYPRSGTTWSDISTNVKTGTLNNGPIYSSEYNGVLIFDGTDDIVIGYSGTLPNTSECTFEMVINMSQWSSYGQIFYIGNGSFNHNIPYIAFSFYNVINTLVFSTNKTSGGSRLVHNTNTIINSNTWYHCIGRMGNGVLSLYLNGVSKSTYNLPSEYIADVANQLTYIGGGVSTGFVSDFNGKIALCRVYNRALSQTEVQQNYYSTLWRFLPNITQSNLILYLDPTSTFSYVSGATSWYNLSSSGLIGTLVNGPTYSTDDGGNITFDGTDDRVNIATYAPTSQLMSFDFWIKVPSPLGNVQSIFSDGRQNNTIGYIWFYFNANGTITYQFARSTTRSQVSVTPFSSGYVDTWVNLTITADYSSKEFKFYRNRQLLSTQTMTDATFPSEGRIRYIGNYTSSTSNPGKFSLSSFIWYSSILSATQVSQNFSSTVWRFLPNIVQNGLVLYVDAGYSFSCISGTTTWYDISSTNVNMPLTNGPTYSTEGGGSILFDGVDDFSQSASLIPLSANWTVEAWFNLTSYPSIANLFSTAYGEGWYASTIFGSRRYFGWYLDGNWRITAENLYTTNQWNHLVAIVSGKNHYYYLNGVQVLSYTSTSTPASVSFGAFGKIYSGSSRYFPGYIAAGRAYNRALTADEVLQNYNAQKSRFGL